MMNADGSGYKQLTDDIENSSPSFSTLREQGLKQFVYGFYLAISRSCFSS